MKFEKALKKLRKGKRIFRKGWIDRSQYWEISDNKLFILIVRNGNKEDKLNLTSADCLLNDDWEIWTPDIVAGKRHEI